MNLHRGAELADGTQEECSNITGLSTLQPNWYSQSICDVFDKEYCRHM